MKIDDIGFDDYTKMYFLNFKKYTSISGIYFFLKSVDRTRKHLVFDVKYNTNMWDKMPLPKVQNLIKQHFNNSSSGWSAEVESLKPSK